MARLLSSGPEKGAHPRRGSTAWTIHGIRYANASAKFWSSIIDELREDFPKCSTMELSSLSSGRLTSDLLYPQRALERDLTSLFFCDPETEMREIIAEMKIVGPPSAVQVRLLSDSTEVHTGQLPLDCVDAEIFPYLLVWMLSWAQVPEDRWNNEHLDGSFTAEDRRRHIACTISFAFTTRHISEGLLLRCAAISSSWGHTFQSPAPS